MDPVFHGWAQKGLDENGFKNGGTKKEFEFRKRLFERILFEGGDWEKMKIDVEK